MTFLACNTAESGRAHLTRSQSCGHGSAVLEALGVAGIAARAPTLSASRQTGSFGLNITPPDLIGPSCAAAGSLAD